MVRRIWAGKKSSEITLYDRYSNALEAIDVNGNYAATKMDSKQEKVLATVANANYNEFAYSGAEDYVIDGLFGGDVTVGESRPVTDYSHSGYYSLEVPSNSEGFGYDVKLNERNYQRTYEVNVWVHEDRANQTKIKWDLENLNTGVVSSNPLIDLSISEARKVGAWYQCKAYIPLDVNDKGTTYSLKIRMVNSGSGKIYLDDFRVHPIDAPMTTYVYNEFDELAYILDANNLYTKYTYNAQGQLVRIDSESFKYGEKKVSEYNVHYHEEPTSNK